MTLAPLAALCVALTSPSHQFTNSSIHPDVRVTRTMNGIRLRIAGVDAQPMDVFIVGGPGLRVFRHKRLDRQRDGSFAVDFALADAGLYMAFAEFVPGDGWPRMAQQAFTIGTGLVPRASDPVDEPHASDGLTATIDVSQVKAGRESTLAFDLGDEASGASAEAFVVSSDLTEGQHLVAGATSRGTRVVFPPVFPHSGRYKVWLIVQHAGRAATIPFTIDVLEVHHLADLDLRLAVRKEVRSALHPLDRLFLRLHLNDREAATRFESLASARA